MGAPLFPMQMPEWIVGFMLGVAFTALCAWIDGWFYRRRYRDQITLARFMDFVHTLDLVSLDMLRHQLDAVRRMHEALRERASEHQP